jgi:hypothetical protein
LDVPVRKNSPQPHFTSQKRPELFKPKEVDKTLPHAYINLYANKDNKNVRITYQSKNNFREPYSLRKGYFRKYLRKLLFLGRVNMEDQQLRCQYLLKVHI